MHELGPGVHGEFDVRQIHQSGILDFENLGRLKL